MLGEPPRPPLLARGGLARPAAALADVARYRDDRAFRELTLLHFAVLPVSRKVGGPKGKANGVVDTRALARRWLEGACGELWAPPQRGPARRRAPQAETVARAKQHRALALCADGLVSKTCVAMRCPLFPTHLRLRLLGRPQHVQVAVCPGWTDEFGRHLAGVINLLAKWQVLDSARPWVCGAKLVALPKELDDVRPIAVGETLCRLAGEALLAPSRAALTEYLEPHQLGVGSKAGAEAAFHAARAWGKLSPLATRPWRPAMCCSLWTWPMRSTPSTARPFSLKLGSTLPS